MARRRMNNTGSIYYREDRKKWIYEIPEHLQALAGRKTYSTTTQRELRILIDNLYKEQESKQVSISNITIPEILYKNEEDKYKKNLISSQTLGRNKETIRIIENSNLGNIPIQSILIKDIDNFSYSIIHYSQSVIDKVFIQLRKAFEIADSKDIIYKNILKTYKKPISNKKTKKVSAFTLEEQKEFIKLIPNSIYFMQYMIMLNTGLRVGEVNALHLNDIDFNKKEININKTITRNADYQDFINDKTKTKNGVRTVPINNILMPYIVDFCEGKEGYLFSNERIISSAMVNSEMKRLCENNEIIKNTVNTHMLRHTFATRCIESGMPAVVLARILGHADVSTTLNTYTDVFNEFKIEHFENATNYMRNLFDGSFDGN